MRKTKLVLTASILLSVFTSACNNQPTVTSTPIAIVVPTNTATATPTATFTATPTATATQTATPTPTETSTPAPTSTATATPKPKPIRIPATATSTITSQSSVALPACTIAPSSSTTFNTETRESGFEVGYVAMCVVEILVRSDGSIQFNVTWTIYESRSGVIYLNLDNENSAMYLTDNLGTHYDYMEVSGAARDQVILYKHNGPKRTHAAGWYVFPAPKSGATSFVFHTGDTNVSIGGLSIPH